MKNAGIYIGIFCALLVACTPPAEPPPTTTTVPPETTTAPPTTTEPVPVPEGKEPAEYIPMDRAPGIAEELTAALQENAWAGWRDPLYVADKCSWALKPYPEALFQFTHDEMERFASVGARLDSDGTGFLQRLSTVNKRCDPSHPEHRPEFCGRSDVLRSRLSEFRSRLTAHLEVARAMRDGLRGQPGYGVTWNSIAGWCQEQQ